LILYLASRKYLSEKRANNSNINKIKLGKAYKNKVELLSLN